MGRKAKKTGVLGRAILRERVKTHGVPSDMATNARHIEDKDVEPDNTGALRSVIEHNDIDEFMSMAQLADRSFEAQRSNVQVVVLGASSVQHEVDPSTLPSDIDLRVPRRPSWDRSMTKAEIDKNEKDSFLEWRRNLAIVEQNPNLKLTPFEKNLEVWRQLWRVIERSDVVVQVVDARQPLLYRCEDLETYVQESSGEKRSVLVLNKADLLSPSFRRMWKRYLDSRGVKHYFFSAAEATQQMEWAGDSNDVPVLSPDELLDTLQNEAELVQNARLVAQGLPIPNRVRVMPEDAQENAGNEEEISAPSDTEAGETAEDTDAQETDESSESEEDEEMVFEKQQQQAKEEVEKKHSRPAQRRPEAVDGVQPVVVGFVGYPNVGKSSTLNALVGSKRVQVGSTPGKTKHFQTIPIDGYLTLCDCPGLVFPNLASSKGAMLLGGVLPIDEMRDHVEATQLLCERIPKTVLEAAYGIVLPDPEIKGSMYYRDVLQAYACVRGYMSKHAPNESMAARFLLKDYVKGKLLWVNGPPGAPMEAVEAARREAPANTESVQVVAAEQKVEDRVQRRGEMKPTNAKFALEDDIPVFEEAAPEQLLAAAMGPGGKKRGGGGKGARKQAKHEQRRAERLGLDLNKGMGSLGFVAKKPSGV